MSQADHDTLIVSSSGSPISGRTDGVGVVPDAGGDATTTDGLVSIENGNFGVPIGDPSLWCREFIDFNGFFKVADDGATFVNQLGPWTASGTASSPTLARKADKASGALELKLGNTSEAKGYGLCWGDELNINSDQGPILRCRLQYQTQPAAADSLSWGFCGPFNELIDSTANNAIFKIAGANDNLLVESDNASTNDDDNDTTVDMVAATYMEFMVSMNPIHGASATDVRYYYRSTLGGNWTRVLSSTTFAFGASTALQPIFQVEKTVGTTTPDLLIDYIDVCWLRV